MKGKALLTGLTGFPGEVTCKVRIVRRAEEPGTPDWDKLTKIQPGECLVSGSFGPQQNTYLFKAAGLIADTFSSHGQIVADSRQYPCIVDTETFSKANASDVLHDGQMIVLEGYTQTRKTIKNPGTPSEKIKEEKIGTVYEYIADTGPSSTSTPTPTATAPKNITPACPVNDPYAGMTSTQRMQAILNKYKSQLK